MVPSTMARAAETDENSRILLEYSFDSKGNLHTEYLSNAGTSDVLAFSDTGLAAMAEDGTASTEYVGLGLAIDDMSGPES